MRCLITSDWHLDAVTAGVERYEDVAEAAASTVAAAVARQVDLFVFLGDLTNPGTVRSHRAVAFLASVLMRLGAEGIHGVFLPGNHDVVEDGHGTTTLAPIAEAFPDIATFATRPSFGMLLGEGLPFIAMPYTARSGDYDPAAFAEEAVAELMKLRKKWVWPPIVLGHLWLQGAIEGGEAEMPRGRELVWPVEVNAAFARENIQPLLVNGHYHAGGRVGDVIIPGSLQRLTFGEEGNIPGYLIAETASATDPWKVEHIGVASPRPLRTIETTNKAWSNKRLPAKKALRTFAEDGAIIRLRPPAGGAERAEALKAALLDAGAAAVKVLPPEPGSATVVNNPTKAAPVRSNRDVILSIVEEANTDDRDALRALVEDTMDGVGL